MMDRIKRRHIACLALLALLVIWGVFYWSNDQSAYPSIIRPYDADKDFLPLVTLMNDNKFWVSENQNFSPEKALISRTPSSDPHVKGQVSIDVIESDSKTAGFIAFYKRSSEQGAIWLLAVDPEFRGLGFGESLMSHAILKLKQRGARQISLGTRLINKRALALYKKMGFVEKSRDEKSGMVTLIKKNL